MEAGDGRVTVLDQQSVLFEALAAYTGLVAVWMALAGVFCLVVTVHIAVRKGYNPLFWLLWGLLFGPLAMLAIGLYPDKR